MYLTVQDKTVSPSVFYHSELFFMCFVLISVALYLSTICRQEGGLIVNLYHHGDKLRTLHTGYTQYLP